jgi:hypothetical protein
MSRTDILFLCIGFKIVTDEIIYSDNSITVITTQSKTFYEKRWCYNKCMAK